MKKIISLALCLILMVSISLPVNVMAAETVTAQGVGFTDVPFSNAYRGFCINWDFDGAYVGDQFAVVGTSPATTNLDGVDVSQQLKLLFTQCFGDIFEENSNGGYTMKGGTIPSDVQYTIYHYTDNFKNNWGNQLTWIGVIDGYNGSPIPDNGYVLTLENGDKITFNFMVMKTGNAEQQNFFAYKISVKKASEHEHSGGTATCEKEAVCEDCGESYGEKDKNNHVGETEIRNAKEATTTEEGYTGDTYCTTCDGKIKDGEIIPVIHEHKHSDKWSGNETEHWHECACGDKADKEEHSGGTATCEKEAVCEDCGKPYGEKDKDNHVGETEIKNAKEATTTEEGYTGDTYCTTCDEKIKDGETIPVIHEHDHADEWSGDEKEHWHECSCGDKADKEEHSGGTATCEKEAVCEDCGKPYGEKDKDNHVGETEIKNAKEATTTEEGYTGDTYCTTCDEKIEDGEKIPVVHEHDYADEWSSGNGKHWHECKCGDKKDEAAHTYKDGKCTVCGAKKSSSYVPQTGDDSHSYLWAGALLLSVCCLVLLIRRLKRNTKT